LLACQAGGDNPRIARQSRAAEALLVATPLRGTGHVVLFVGDVCAVPTTLTEVVYAGARHIINGFPRAI